MKFRFKRAGAKMLMGLILLKKEDSGQSDETSGFVRRLVIMWGSTETYNNMAAAPNLHLKTIWWK